MKYSGKYVILHLTISRMPFSKVAGDQTGTLLWRGGAEGVAQWSGAHRCPSSVLRTHTGWFTTVR